MKSCLIILSLLGSIWLSAQSLEKSNGNDRVGLRTTEDLSFGLRLHTNGWSISGTYGKITGAQKSRYWHFELMEIQHPKEVRQSNDFALGRFGISPKPFVFGKANAFYALNVGFGNRKLIGGKAERSGVEVNLVYQAGPSLGMAKPYYLDLIYETDNPFDPRIIPQRLTEENREKFLDPSSIYGASGFTRGLSELRIFPGVHGKAGLSFDWASYNEFVTALEVGIGLNAYARRIPIMAEEQNNAYFIFLYLGIHVGKKW